MSDIIDWFRKRPFVIHLICYTVIVIGLLSLSLYTYDNNEDFKNSLDNDPCGVKPLSKECQVAFDSFVQIMTPHQTGIIVCKGLEKIGRPCTKEELKEINE